MQAKNAQNRTFLNRTDLLSSKMEINVVDLTDVLSLAKSTLFAGRKSDEAVSRKTWLKLEAAERAAGIGGSEDGENGGGGKNGASEADDLEGRLMKKFADTEARFERVERMLEELLRQSGQETSCFSDVKDELKKIS